MDIVNYVLRPSNLPSDTPLYQPVIEDQTVFSLKDLSTAVGVENGYATSTVENILAGVNKVLPSFLAKGSVDLGVVGLRLAMTGTTENPDTNYNALNAPLNIKVKLTNKSALIQAVRMLISMQRGTYVPKVPTVTRIENLYEVEGIPVSHTFQLVGQNLLNPTKKLTATVCTTEDMINNPNSAFLTESILNTKTTIIDVLPTSLRDSTQDWRYIRFSFYDEVALTEQQISSVYRMIYGGIKYLVLPYYQAGYRDGGQSVRFKVTNTAGVLSVSLAAHDNLGTFGTPVDITGEGLYTLTDSATPTAHDFVVYASSGFVGYYTTLLPPGENVNIDGFIEDGYSL